MATSTRFESYEEAVAQHEWSVPERYNIAEDVCDKHPADKLAMIHEDFEGTVREVRWGELQEKSNRFANVLRAHVAKEIGALARPDEIRFTDALPKTRSGKIMRRLLRELAASGAVKGDVTTLEDFSVIEKLRAQEEE